MDVLESGRTIEFQNSDEIQNSEQFCEHSFQYACHRKPVVWLGTISEARRFAATIEQRQTFSGRCLADSFGEIAKNDQKIFGLRLLEYCKPGIELDKSH
jgi:hypothetical protein